MTTINKIQMIVCAIALVASVNANAQVDTTKVDTTTIDGPVLQAIFGESTDRGCWHPEIREGVPTKTRCDGVRAGLGMEIQNTNWSSDLGKGTNMAFGPVVSIGYKQNYMEGIVSYAHLFGGSIEGQSLSMPKASIGLRGWTTKHDHRKFIKGFLEAGFSYMSVKSIDRVDLGPEWETFEIPFHGYACFAKFGVGMEWNFCEIVKHRKTTVGKNNFMLDVVSHLALNVGAYYEASVVKKLEHYKDKSSVNLNDFSFRVTLVYKGF